MKALLLCAGRGSRLHPYTRACSKIALPFLNIPIAGYPLKVLEDIGVRHLLVNTHHWPQQVVNTIECLISSVRERAEPASRFSHMKKPSRQTFKAQTYVLPQNRLPIHPVPPQKSGRKVHSAPCAAPAKAGIQSLSFSYEPRLLEGLGSLKKNKSFFAGEENLICFNGDSVFLCGGFFPQMLAQHRQKKALNDFFCAPLSKREPVIYGRIKKEESF